MPSVISEVSAAQLARALEDFLAGYPRAAVLEDGRVLFDMQRARYALSSDHGRCVLQLWSDERNIVRTVTGISARKDTLRIETRRFGQVRPQTLELVADRDRRTPSARETTRKRYLRVLERVLMRAFPDYSIGDLHSAMDLEHSFGPAYARATLVRGPKAWAVIAVNAQEMQSTLDGALTLGILWLNYCREHSGGRRVFEGLKVILPEGKAEVTRARMAWLNPALAKWELYALDERSEELEQLIIEEGNLETRLVHAITPSRVKERMQDAMERVLALLPDSMHSRVEIYVTSTAEISFRLQGLDYWIRVRRVHADGDLDQHGYFPGVELSDRPPLLMLVAPALRIHPANETILRHLKPEVEWTLIALDEHWRQHLRVIFRKRREAADSGKPLS